MRINKVSMRDVYGDELVKLGEAYPDLVVLDADVSSSTKTVFFSRKYPERFFNVGVAEANMVDIAAGLALSGLRVIANSFAVFLTLKTMEQIRNVICYNNLSVILTGSYAGLSDSYDGASHQAIEDIAIMRAIPNLNVVVPADAEELRVALSEIMRLSKPTYLRICRNPTPVLFNSGNTVFTFGKIQTMRRGKDVTIAACGITVAIALEAVERLSVLGISVELLNVSTIKPLDKDTLIASVKKTNCLLSVEEHSVLGGLGSAIAEVLGKEYPTAIDYVGIPDTFTETGAYEELLKKYQVSTDVIIRKVQILIQSKSS